MADYRPGLNELPTYSVEEREWEIKIDANESSFNLPPLVQERLMNRLAGLAFNRYPDIGMKGLKEQIAGNFQLRSDNVLIGNGSSEILEKLFHAYGGGGRSIVFPAPSFSMYDIYAKLSESRAIPVQLESDYSLRPDKVLAAARDSAAKLIVLCTPNNPTGNAMEEQDIEYIVQQAGCPVVVDEAYIEFHGRSAVDLLNRYANVMIARTFSKAYGFASARIGYLIAAADIVAMLGKICMPYHVNALSLAGAEIIYQMRNEFAPYIQQTIGERRQLAAALEELPGVTVYSSVTNFLLVKFTQAGRVAAVLAEHGIGVRDFSSVPGLIDCLRISIGTPAQNDRVLKIITGCRERG
ncbi:histidinol-phosphate transaminase|uniref:Histidinol-phosphate aminotransferase n=1 Tax=Dendrosporobacter quercicolus TaxID=146817 RepID=A0A1G9NWN6_9FIRM|nr:histidinol-phosphate transaminase [Dendrosporobacter quercicolus]NSL47467.1 histidinol-phosphate transaminase [Dendrosporobacter quercicolus DSM 1736]SDL90790.1 histidinol-phosphate aminotransferase [Dendrosporobacter quercicolus]